MLNFNPKLVRKYAVGKADDIKLIGVVGWKTLDPSNRENMINSNGQKCSYFPTKSDNYSQIDNRHPYQARDRMIVSSFKCLEFSLINMKY